MDKREILYSYVWGEGKIKYGIKSSLTLNETYM